MASKGDLFNFGKYRGQLTKQVFMNHPVYVRNMIRFGHITLGSIVDTLLNESRRLDSGEEVARLFYRLPPEERAKFFNYLGDRENFDGYQMEDTFNSEPFDLDGVHAIRVIAASAELPAITFKNMGAHEADQ